MLTYYVTKYALTAGIMKVKGKLSHDGSFISFKRSKEQWITEYAHGADFHSTLELANIRAEVMRQKRIASAEKNLDKLRKMGVFKVVDCQ
jgi:hypothetical protein